MELTSTFTLKSLLSKYNLWLKKSLGQHFLIDRNILEKIINEADLKKDDIILEIGAGIGIFTKELAKRVKKVIPVEIDKKMIEILNEVMKEEVKSKKVEIIQGDILKIKNLKLKTKNFKIVANIPYQITSSILEKFLSPKRLTLNPKLLILMVQKEIAEKICSQPPKMSRIGVFVQFFGNPEIIAQVSKNCFWPKPEVDSAILKISPYSKPYTLYPKRFFGLVKKGFSQKRKQLKNIFGKEILKNAGIMPKKRAEELSLDDWKKLFRASVKKKVLT